MIAIKRGKCAAASPHENPLFCLWQALWRSTTTARCKKLSNGRGISD